MLGPEPAARAAESADHFVRDQEDPVLAADALDLRPVSRRRDDHAARALDRLADEGGDPLRSDFLDLLRKAARRAKPVFLRAHVDAVFEPVRLLDVDDAGDRQSALCMHRLHAAEARRRDRAAVIRVETADDDGALRLTHQVPVAARHAQDRVVRLGARLREEHAVELRRRQLIEELCQLDRRRVRTLEKAVVVRKLAHLPRGGISQLVAAITDVDAPEPRHCVEDLLAFAVVEVHALGARDDARAFGGERPEVSERMQVVAGVEFLPVARRSFRDAWLRAHVTPANQTFSNRCSRSHELMTRENVSYSFSLTAQYAATKRSPNTSTSGLLARSSVIASASVSGSENGRS